MKQISISVFFLTFLVGIPLANAQLGSAPSGSRGAFPTYGSTTGQAGPVYHEGGWMSGGSISIGNLDVDEKNGPLRCGGCETKWLALQVDLIGGSLISPNMAILGEFHATALPVSEEDDANIIQSMALLSVQYWVNPRSWLRGGIGVAHLSLTDDKYETDVAEGPAISLAAGYEILNTPRRSIDIQVRLAAGNYRGTRPSVDGEEFNSAYISATVGVGFSWFNRWY